MLKPGLSTKIEIRNEKYSSYIEDVDNKSIFLATPISGGAPVMVRKNEKIKVWVFVKASMYEFDATVLKTYTEPLPMLKIEKPKKAKKIQRRSFFRLEKTIPVEYYILDKDGSKENSEKFEANFLDISGGGAKLSTEKNVPFGAHLEFNIYLDDGKDDLPLVCIGKVVHSKKIDTEKVKIYHYGIEFVSLTMDLQERIVQYTFEEQRKMRLKGRFSNNERE